MPRAQNGGVVGRMVWLRLTLPTRDVKIRVRAVIPAYRATKHSPFVTQQGLHGQCIGGESNMAQGFVYVFMNPAFPDHVKIGKTTRAPEDRAKELSGATGVPTPFVVAYYGCFPDCDRAESYVHALLERRGVARTSNREFFAISVRDAIAVVMEAEAALQSTVTTGDSDSDTAEASDGIQTLEDAPLWEQLSREADDYRFGLGDVIQDEDRAMALYKQAVQLGARDEAVFTALAELHAARGNDEEGIRWLMQGGENGVVGCWAELALIYTGENTYFGTRATATDIDILKASLERDAENARKAWRRFFRSVNHATFDPDYPGGDRLYAMLRRYVALIRNYPLPSDLDVIQSFADRFAESIEGLPDEADRDSRLTQLRSLVAGLSQERPVDLPRRRRRWFGWRASRDKG